MVGYVSDNTNLVLFGNFTGQLRAAGLRSELNDFGA